MSILKKLDLFLANMGNLKAMQRNHTDTFTESKIENIKGEKIASSENGGIWIEFQELAEYHFMNVIIVGKKKIKTFNGCELVFVGKENEMKLKSDMQEIVSDFSNISNRWITFLSFDITDLNIDFILNKEAEKATLYFKKDSEIFDILK